MYKQSCKNKKKRKRKNKKKKKKKRKKIINQSQNPNPNKNNKTTKIMTNKIIINIYLKNKKCNNYHNNKKQIKVNKINNN